MPKLSICIPTYNRALYLRRCLQSVLSTKDNDIEVIVQDNCSPDNTEEIVNCFGDSRVKYYKNPKNIGGVLNAISIIEKANGDFIFFLTDDDYMLPGSIEKIKVFIEKGVDCFTSDTIMYLEKQKKANNYSYFNNDIIDCSSKDKDEITQIFLSAHIISRCCFKRDLIDMEFLKLHGDNWYPQMLIVLLFYLRNARIGYLADPIVMHTWENETFWGISNDNSQVLHQGQVNIIMSVYPHIDEEMFNCLVHHFSLKFGYVHEDFSKVLTNENRNKILSEIKKSDIEKQNTILNINLLKIINRKIYIWGTGKAAHDCYNVLCEINMSGMILGFIDSNSSKWDDCFNDKIIYSPNKLNELNDNCMVIIGSMYYDEIGRGLESLGFEQISERIYLNNI
jgi:glycosyltransferase involved in cell wall biosynthesis